MDGYVTLINRNPISQSVHAHNALVVHNNRSGKRPGATADAGPLLNRILLLP